MLCQKETSFFFAKSSNRGGAGLEARRSRFEAQNHFVVTIVVFPGTPLSSSLWSPPAGGHSQKASRDPGEGDGPAATTGAKQETTQRNVSHWNESEGPRLALSARRLASRPRPCSDERIGSSRIARKLG